MTPGPTTSPRLRMIPSQGTPRRYLVCLLLVAATIAVYGRAVLFDFVNYDDLAYVVENPHVQAGFTGVGVGWALASTEQSNWHPLTWVSLMLDASIGGSDPRVFHATSILLHAVNTLLLFLSVAGGALALFALGRIAFGAVA